LHERETAPITRTHLIECLKDLAKEFRKLGGKKQPPAEIILIGGAAVLIGYGFRELTCDVDAIIVAAPTMKDAISRVSDKHGLPAGWLNADFKRTASYSDKLFEVSVYYKTFSNVLTIRTITAEYLLAMKLMSGRQYKNDLSDIVGILWEHQKKGEPIAREAVGKAVEYLYGKGAKIPEISAQLLDAAFASGDYGALYARVNDNELASRELFLEIDSKYPNTLKDNNIDAVLSTARQRRSGEQRESALAKLEEKKRLADKIKQDADTPAGVPSKDESGL